MDSSWNNRPGWRAAVLYAVLLVALAGCSSKDIDPDDLPAELVSFKQTLKIKKVWSRSIGGGTEYLRLALHPDEDGVKIYAGAHNGNVAAMDLATGARVWKTSTKLPLSAGPGTDGEFVVAGSSNGDVVALDAKTGEKLWAAPHPPSGYCSPEDTFVVDGLVWTADVTSRNAAGTFTGRDLRTGEVQAEFPGNDGRHMPHHRCHRAKATDIFRQHAATFDKTGKEVALGVREGVLRELLHRGIHTLAAQIWWVHHHRVVLSRQ